MQAIKAVSQYVIENEAEFISQLKTVWNESKSKSANNGQQEIDEAKKRMAELDAKIQKLYDSAISGLLPERQAQRMIQQYDEEQLMLEKRVEELQGQIQEEEVEKIDTNRFIALVNKYRNCEELTDTICRFYFINYQGGLLNENEPEGNENPVYLWLSEP